MVDWHTRSDTNSNGWHLDMGWFGAYTWYLLGSVLMSFCPKCHQTDKNFFAPQCHNCNEPVGFLEQCAHSLLVVAANIFGVIFGGWLLWQVLLAVF
jgi:hypothetical protein